MISFDDKILVLDCQTTGMHPKNSYIVQLGWCLFDPNCEQAPLVEKRILQLPENVIIPQKVMKLLQLESGDFSNAVSPLDTMVELASVIQSLSLNPPVLIHYAQFEVSFLKHYFLHVLELKELPLTPICTQKLSKAFLPHLPSYTLKGLAGHFKLGIEPKNDVISHIKVTICVWKEIRKQFIKHELNNLVDVTQWIKNLPKKTARNYLYNIEASTRLRLSTSPGVYKMLGREGQILYIGKAVSLKNRVNSYFRGIKNRDKFKLEMLAQVWNIETIECDTGLEAELLESQLIKIYEPPYNILLKKEARYLVFYCKNFHTSALTSCKTYCEGPYRPTNGIATLYEIHQAFLNERPSTLLYPDIDIQQQRASWTLFCELNHLLLNDFTRASVRYLLVTAFKLLRNFEKKQGKYSFEKWWLNEKKTRPQIETPTVADIADRIYRLFIRAAETKRKNNELIKIYHSKMIINAINKPLSFNNSQETMVDIALYDQLSILASAKRKNLISFVE